MRQCHTGDVSTFIQSLFDFTSDLYNLHRTDTVYLGQYGIHLGQYDTCFTSSTDFELNLN